MSLVQTIMESYRDYGNGGLSSSVNAEAYRNATLEGLECDYALLECLTDIVNAQRVVDSADIMGSMTMLLEGTDVSATMEGVIANAFEKIKHTFLKVKDVVVAWFKKVIDKIISFTKNGKEFVSKYGDVLKKKDTKGFEFTGYVWTQKAGDGVVEKACSSIGNKINSLVGDLAAAADMDFDAMKSKIEGKGVKPGNDYKETIIKDMGISGADSVSSMKSAITKAYRDGKDSSSSNLTLTSAQISEYLDYISSAKDAIKKLKENQSTFEKQLNSVIKTIDTISRKEDRGGDKAKNASNVSSALNTLFAVKRQVHDAQVYGYRSMLKGETGILRRFLNWSPKKEAVQNSYYDALADDPMLESDDIIEDEVEECDIDDYAEESTNLSEGAELYNKIAEMLGI